MTIESGSFRDPHGSIFSKNGKIYRSIFKPGAGEFETALSKGIYDKLVGANLMLPFEEVPSFEFAPEGTVHCLSHPRLPMISYPWEWPFSMLKDAALLHLDAMERLIPSGYWLRDASAFNVQYDGDRLCLIDTLSIGQRPSLSPWVAYGQFCSHFLAPLTLAAYCDVRILSLWRSHIDGFPLDMAVNMLPLRRRLQPGLFMHLTLHSRFQKSADKKEDIQKEKTRSKAKLSDQGLAGIVRSLKKTIMGVNWKPTSRIWDSYKEIRTYQDSDISKKSEFVEKAVKNLQPTMVWDLGANTGEFSTIAASHGAFTVSIEGDPACTEFIYNKLSNSGNHSVLPLTMDLANPSPSLGWDHSERFSLHDRGPADLILALALVHHLVFSSCVPLKMIAEWFGRLTKHALVEFVPPDDPMVKKLLAHRSEGGHHPYYLDEFKSAFGKIFKFENQETLSNGRMLFLCKNMAQVI